MNKEAFLHGYTQKEAFELQSSKDNLEPIDKEKLLKNPKMLKTWQAIFEAGERIRNKDIDIRETSGLHRVFIDKKKLDLDQLENIGFKKSVIAVPEQGQKGWMTYRHPDTNFHLHDHDDGYYMHKDKWGALQMLLNKAVGKDIGTQAGAVATGTAHAVLEGIPGWWNYITNGLGNGPTYKDKKEMGRDASDLMETVRQNL